MPDFVNALSLTALVAATLEYAIVMRHREERRDAIRWQEEVRESLMSEAARVGPTCQNVSELVDAAGYTWHMVEWGEPTDPPLLLVHGVTSSSETFWQVGPTLAASGLSVVAVDLPGHGRTGGWRGRHRFIETAEAGSCSRQAASSVGALARENPVAASRLPATLALTGEGA